MLDLAFRRSIVAALGEEYVDVDPQIRPSQRPDLGDFQANFAMGLAKRTGGNPRQLAQQIVAATDVSDLAEPLEVAGPGFINIRLRGEALADMLEAMDTAALGVRSSTDPHTVAIDLCGVNVAKQMHVGHLRSTIIGDALARVLERLGRRVHRENHLGDWGLPIAMVLHQLKTSGVDLDRLELDELDRAYRDAQLSRKADVEGLRLARELGAGPHRIAELEEQNDGAAEALEAAKAMLVKLQQGDPELRRDWQKLIDCTLRALDDALVLLNVELRPEHHRGESFYRDRLAGVVDAFVRAGRREGGARRARRAVRRSRSPDDHPQVRRRLPLRDHRSRRRSLPASSTLTLTGSSTSSTPGSAITSATSSTRPASSAGTASRTERESSSSTSPFGAVLGPDRKPLKTRSGENVTLEALLEEAVERGTARGGRAGAGPRRPDAWAAGRGAAADRPGGRASAPSSTPICRTISCATTCSTSTG